MNDESTPDRLPVAKWNLPFARRHAGTHTHTCRHTTLPHAHCPPLIFSSNIKYSDYFGYKHNIWRHYRWRAAEYTTDRWPSERRGQKIYFAAICCLNSEFFLPAKWVGSSSLSLCHWLPQGICDEAFVLDERAHRFSWESISLTRKQSRIRHSKACKIL